MKSFYLWIWNFLEVGGLSEKIMEIPGGGGKSSEALWNGKSWGGGVSNWKKPSVSGVGGGVWIFSGTTHYSLCMITSL